MEIAGKSYKVSVFRIVNNGLLLFSRVTDSRVCACNGQILKLGIIHNTKEWLLLSNAAKMSLKAFLLWIGNKLPFCSNEGNLRKHAASYSRSPYIRKPSFEIFKRPGILLGMQSGITKYLCFVFLWDSRFTEQHYIEKEWPLHEFK